MKASPIVLRVWISLSARPILRRGPSSGCMSYTISMSEKPKTQKTPKGHEIAVPTREEFETNLDKVAKPVKESPHRRPKKG